jgi:hypothetical protein
LGGFTFVVGNYSFKTVFGTYGPLALLRLPASVVFIVILFHLVKPKAAWAGISVYERLGFSADVVERAPNFFPIASLVVEA